MRHIPCLLISACFAAALCQWFVLLLVFMDLESLGQKMGFGPNMISLGDSGLFAFFVASAGLISLCFVSRRGLRRGSPWRVVATAVMWGLTGGAALLALGLCTPYIAIVDR
jgi:hypothetical protein